VSDSVTDETASPERQDDVTRRRLLATAGGVTAGGLLVLGLPDVADAGGRPRRIAVGRTDQRSIGFIVQMNQVGPSLTAFGFLTRVRGLDDGDLFTTPPARSSNDPRSGDPGPARFTLFSENQVESLSKTGDVISTLARGEIRFFHRPAGGATFDDPSSFRGGSEVASLEGLFQTHLALEGQDRALVTISADLKQRAARRLAIGDRVVRFGARRLPWSLEATGRGERTEPTTPRARFFLTGELGVVDAERAR
jgi:hypothetical protein